MDIIKLKWEDMSTIIVVFKSMNLPKNLDLLSEKQKEVSNAFVSGNDVFCCFPTGYGK